MAKTLAGGGKKTKNEDEAGVIPAGSQNEGVGKRPVKQNVLGVSGEAANTDVDFANTDTEEEPTEVHLNHVGQKIDTPISDVESYVTPQGKIMHVQMEDEEGQVFAGEHGKNAKFYPKKIVDTWVKYEAPKVKAAKESKEEKPEK